MWIIFATKNTEPKFGLSVCGVSPAARVSSLHRGELTNPSAGGQCRSIWVLAPYAGGIGILSYASCIFTEHPVSSLHEADLDRLSRPTNKSN